MKQLLFALALALTTVTAAATIAMAAGTQDYIATARYTDAAACAKTVNLLTQLSSPELKIKVTENCKLHKPSNKAGRIAARVLVAAGTWGVSEAACAHDHDGIGCGKNETYYEMEAELKTAKNMRMAAAQPLAMTEQQCFESAEAVAGLRLYGKKALLETTCTKGTFAAGLAVQK